jgi:hypothetical protein
MAEKINVTFNKNVKLDGDRYKKGDSLPVEKAVHDELRNLGVIESSNASKDDSQEPEDYFSYTAEQLSKVNNDKLKAFLDDENIEYPSGATKPVLVKLILGEDVE